MRNIDWETWGPMLVAFVLVVLMLTYLGSWAKAERKCLAAGYKSGKIDVLLTGYCIKRVDQTDVVVPLKKI